MPTGFVGGSLRGFGIAISTSAFTAPAGTDTPERMEVSGGLALLDQQTLMSRDGELSEFQYSAGLFGPSVLAE